jgi:2-dehydro-3-deoxygluconokinase
VTGRGRIVCFGELLLRLNAPGRERLLQTNRLDVHVGGAEANVAIALAQLGHDAQMASVASDNALGDACLRTLRSHGVDTGQIHRADGRQGLYFMSSGAVRRPSEVLYDRADSVFVSAQPEGSAWCEAVAAADRLHLSGITPATGAAPAAMAQRLVRAAVAAETQVSFDGNYREALWRSWGGDAAAVLHDLLDHASLAFINEKDLALITGRQFADAEEAFAHAFDTFPRLDLIACTKRDQTAVDDHQLAAIVRTRSERIETEAVALHGVVDRIGGGDAYAAGVLHAVMREAPPAEIARTGLAAAILKHSIPGDCLISSAAELDALTHETGLDVRR